MFPLRLRTFFVFIGLLLLCSVEDIEQENTSQNAAPRNSISGMSLIIVCLYMEILIAIGVDVF